MLFAFRVPGQQGTAVSLPDPVTIPDVSPETESKQFDDAEDKSSSKVGDTDAAADDVSPCAPPKRKRPCLRDVRELEKQITKHRMTIELLHQKYQAAMNAPLSCDECDACRDEAIIMFIKFEL